MGKTLDRLKQTHPGLFPDLTAAQKWEADLEVLVAECYHGDDSHTKILEDSLMEVAARQFRTSTSEAIYNGTIYARCCGKMVRTPQVWADGLLPVHDCSPLHAVEIYDSRTSNDIIIPTSLSVKQAKKLTPEYEFAARKLEKETVAVKHNRQTLLAALGGKI